MTLITYRGRTQSISAWSRELGFSTGTLHSRLGKLGQTVEQAFTAPVDRSKSPAARPKVVRKIKGPPKLEAHHSGRARVRWYEGGRRREVFLGLFGAEATANAYARFCAEWYANQGHVALPAGAGLGVAELLLQYLDWSDVYFVKDGKPTSRARSFRFVAKLINECYGDAVAAEFGPNQLRVLQDRWVKSGYCRRTVNAYVRTTVQIFSWGVGRGLIGPAGADAMAHVPPLAEGRTAAPDRPPIGPAKDADIEKILPTSTPTRSAGRYSRRWSRSND